jgi:hypothetical protein
MMFPAERAARAATLTAGLGMGIDLVKEQVSAVEPRRSGSLTLPCGSPKSLPL